MILSLDYGNLNGTLYETNRLAHALEQYADDLFGKVRRRLFDLDGSPALDDADFYLNRKVNNVQARLTNARTLEIDVARLVEAAIAADTAVRRVIEGTNKRFSSGLARNKPITTTEGIAPLGDSFIATAKTSGVIRELYIAQTRAKPLTVSEDVKTYIQGFYTQGFTEGVL